VILIGPEGAASVSGHMVGSFAPQDLNTDEFYADFGAMIGARRKELGLSQDALAAKLSHNGIPSFGPSSAPVCTIPRCRLRARNRGY
jgi:hypothetical protein